MTTIRASWNSDYFQCYTMGGSLLNDMDRSQIAGLVAILYIEEFQESIESVFYPSLRHSEANGARVLVHPANTAPYMGGGLNVGPGTESVVTIQQTTRQRQPEPYSNCTDGTGWLENQGHAYSVQYCVDTCIQEKIVEECGCLESSLQFTKDQLLRTNYTVCENISQWYFVDKLLCAARLITANRADCEVNCTLPCTEQIYDSSLSSAQWPNLARQQSFINTHVEGDGRFASIMNVYNDILEATGSDYNWSFLQALKSSGIITDNFLQLNVLFGSTAYTELVDVVAFPIDSMGAQTAGVLAFWLGLTVMFICEIAEFIYSYCRAKKQSGASDQGTHLGETVVQP